jgi:hypothetical protein
MREQEFPVNLTARQIQRLHEQVRRENSRAEANGAVPPDDHNLERKLSEYCSTARRIPGAQR